MHGRPTGGIVARIVQTSGQSWRPIRYSEIVSAAGTADLEIWFADLAIFAQVLKPTFEGLLEPERARLAHLANDHARQRFLCCRALLRTVLSAYLGAPPDSLVFTHAVHGKPSLIPAMGLEFNQSHSTGSDWDIWALAVARSGAVGLDIEGRRAVPQAERLSQRVFSTTEREALASAAAHSEAERDQAFLWGWTRKEALLKAIGAGFADGARHLQVGLEPATTLLSVNDGRWWLHSLRSPRDHPIGCAASFVPMRVVCFELIP